MSIHFGAARFLKQLAEENAEETDKEKKGFRNTDRQKESEHETRQTIYNWGETILATASTVAEQNNLHLSQL